MMGVWTLLESHPDWSMDNVRALRGMNTPRSQRVWDTLEVKHTGEWTPEITHVVVLDSPQVAQTGCEHPWCPMRRGHSWGHSD